MESSRRGRADPAGALMEATGLHFLDGTCAACDGISRESQVFYKSIENGRMLAFDGVKAAVSVIEDGTILFCQNISPGLFNLGWVRSFYKSSTTLEFSWCFLSVLRETSDSC